MREGGVALMDEKFHQFQIRLNEYMNVGPYDEALDYIEVLFDIIEGEGNYDFDFEELRLRPHLVLCAVLLSKWKDKTVTFVCPTTYYSVQALRFIRSFSKEQTPAKISVCPAGYVSDELARNTDVFLHHGRDFRQFLPKSAIDKRHIFQIFQGEDVPNDSRSLSVLVRASYNDN